MFILFTVSCFVYIMQPVIILSNIISFQYIILAQVPTPVCICIPLPTWRWSFELTVDASEQVYLVCTNMVVMCCGVWNPLCFLIEKSQRFQPGAEAGLGSCKFFHRGIPVQWRSITQHSCTREKDVQHKTPGSNTENKNVANKL